ncbi:MAG: hypothetical protein R3D67_17755 [Hyphomicrobiaceae bacterium]
MASTADLADSPATPVLTGGRPVVDPGLMLDHPTALGCIPAGNAHELVGLAERKT